jgi:hypothetical protein
MATNNYRRTLRVQEVVGRQAKSGGGSYSESTITGIGGQVKGCQMRRKR